MLGLLLPAIIQGFAFSAAGTAGSIAAQAAYDKWAKANPEEAKHAKAKGEVKESKPQGELKASLR